MGHGGHHAGMYLDDMVRDMRNRFIVAAVLSGPILLWSPIGREVVGFTLAAPSGLRMTCWALRVPLEHLGARICPDMFSLARAHEAFDEAGQLLDPELAPFCQR